MARQGAVVVWNYDGQMSIVVTNILLHREKQDRIDGLLASYKLSLVSK